MILAAASPSYWSITLSILTILGALGVFLYGMKVMSEGVQKVAGEKMRAALASMTANRWSGIFTGFFLTSMIQSSSATTVLVVSFVNAGLLTLVESIGVIMGANLGTTITAWIVAVVGKFQVSAIALPLIGLALPFLFADRDRGKSWAETIIGFGFVLFGLGLLKDAVPDLRSMLKDGDPAAMWVRDVMTAMGGHGFGSVLMYLAAGIVLTLMVQSSSAAMAITITCALNGWLGDLDGDPLGVFRNSAAIVLGENIGTTVTAWLAALGANVSAKRAARAHFLFNVIGVGWMLVVFQPFCEMIWKLTGFLPSWMRSAEAAFQHSEIAFATAIFHSSFNLANICLLVWFIPQITRAVQWLVKDRDGAEDPKLRYLSGRLLDLGELNIAEAETATRRMADLTGSMFDGFLEVLEKPQEDLSVMVTGLKKMENSCDEMLHDITTYLIQCSSREIGSRNAERVSAMMRVVSEYEEATDRIYRLVKTVQRKYKQGRDFSEQQHRDLRAICTEVRAMLDAATNSLSGGTRELLDTTMALEDRVDVLRKQHYRQALLSMQHGGDVTAEMLFIEMNNHLEGVGNHALNIVEFSMPEAQRPRS